MILPYARGGGKITLGVVVQLLVPATLWDKHWVEANKASSVQPVEQLAEAAVYFIHLPGVEMFVSVTRQELAEEAVHADSCILIKYHIRHMMGY